MGIHNVRRTEPDVSKLFKQSKQLHKSKLQCFFVARHQSRGGMLASPPVTGLALSLVPHCALHSHSHLSHISRYSVNLEHIPEGDGSGWRYSRASITRFRTALLEVVDPVDRLHPIASCHRRPSRRAGAPPCMLLWPCVPALSYSGRSTLQHRPDTAHEEWISRLSQGTGRYWPMNIDRAPNTATDVLHLLRLMSHHI